MSRRSLSGVLQDALSGLRKLGRGDPVSLLIGEIDTTEAQVLRIFRDGLGCAEQQIRSIEISYFAAAAASFLYRRLHPEPARGKIADEVVRTALEDSVAAFEPELTDEEAMQEFRQRASAYENFLSALLRHEQMADLQPSLSLMDRLFEYVTGGPADEHAEPVDAAAGLLASLIQDLDQRLRRIR